jgi:predicted alpha/beta-fold hydrolase
VGRIRRPVLLINALGDPIVPAEALPDPARLPPHVRAEFVPTGGHAAFLEGPWALTSCAERSALDFLTGVVVDGGRIC